MVEFRAIQAGEKLPATRELAGLLGLNRTTVSAAYAVLEQAGLIQGHVGRGSFVAKSADSESTDGETVDWDSLLPPLENFAPVAGKIEISFASSRPAERSFPLVEFRRLTKEVVDSPESTQILQLGSSHGYPPLRRYLLGEAISAGVARVTDDILITNGCQQALDLLARLFFAADRARPANGGVVLEDPVYHGLIRVFSRAGANIYQLPTDNAGLDPAQLEDVFKRHRPRLLAVTPSFQNPTGVTLPLDRRKRIVELAQQYSVILVENDIYSELRYHGPALPTLKELDDSGNTILLRSYSKVSFPGLRVGWVIAPQPVIARLAEAKQLSDLHSDQLSQAVLLRFAESGELARHLERTRSTGSELLAAVLDACVRFLPPGSRFTRPLGGMSLWVELPAPLLAESLLRRSAGRGVDFLPGSYFSARRAHPRAFRLSFGGLNGEEIVRGLKILGDAARAELAAIAQAAALDPVAALV